MSAPDTEGKDSDRYIGFRLESADDKQRAKMRLAQLGHDNMTEYMRSLVESDLEDANLPPLE